jgi:hypothetical protein
VTTCSNHPGTIAGADLKQLLEESDRLGDLLRQRIEAAARSQNLDFSAYSLLTRIAGGFETTADESLAGLRVRGLVSDANGGASASLLPAGAQMIAAINGELCAWLDEHAADGKEQDYRELAEKLHAVRQRVS